MRTWTVRELRDALDDLITRRRESATYEVLLPDLYGLTAVEPDYELGVVVLVSGADDLGVLERTQRGG
jgi:hypothetical protein